jgi:hypothetical protein
MCRFRNIISVFWFFPLCLNILNILWTCFSISYLSIPHMYFNHPCISVWKFYASYIRTFSLCFTVSPLFETPLCCQLQDFISCIWLTHWCLTCSLLCSTCKKNYTIKPRVVLPENYVKGKLGLFLCMSQCMEYVEVSIFYFYLHASTEYIWIMFTDSSCLITDHIFHSFIGLKS